MRSRFIPFVALSASVACAPVKPVVMPPSAVPRDTALATPVDPSPIVASDSVTLADLPPLRREFRAAWVSPVWGSGLKDWPSRVGLSADEQRSELRALLDHARDLGLNAVILHVRTAGDALFPSEFAPWSPYLSGTSGVPPSPYYDPLAFAIEEAHARGLQLHAWFNPFRALIPGLSGSIASAHVARTHPEWVERYGTQTWIDPGEPAARRAVLASMLEVVRKYDVDGVHIDDYFYPYRERAPIPVHKSWRRMPAGDLPFPDDDSWARYGVAAGWNDRASWRRANVDELVRDLYAGVKREKPWVLVGISPFGIWRPGHPPGITGLDAHGEIYADARRWWREGWADYFAPQLYWELDGEQYRFRRLDQWWREENRHARHLWPGLHTARVVGESRAWALSEIPRQIVWLRNQRAGTDESQGHVHFRLASIRTGHGGLFDRLRPLYADHALVPPSPWLDARAPRRPHRVDVANAGVVLITPADSAPLRWWVLRARDRAGTWRTEVHPASDRAIRTSLADTRAYPLLAVSAVGRTELESAATIARAR